jgi:hypothetical protein
MVIIIKIKYIFFTLLLPTTYFVSLYRSHFQAELYFLKKIKSTFDSTVIDCDISHYVFQILLIKII